MLILDDILLFPCKSLLWIFREINNAAEEEFYGQREAISIELSDIYMMLETGQITEEDFEVREKELLDRLDSITESEDDLD